eukprot:Protomagalhaensia_sp_Gyna_25__4637@NODE_42_length_6385_cov_204_458714_g31_i0_p4_GENE_NODE_42_length_6385_cov_204_458714_g31_i0NODE_42_length_6385_cov_204_458714_g31_i0_p4_ORF_typecomplete_len257_score44_69Lactamase_B_3/PF13483_6/6_4e24Lactamase_B_2/PF12706_7/3_4e11Lactamase_B/PF00753_27/1e08_NODE_42_length_6385_cov_204_458714_g31_i019292699
MKITQVRNATLIVEYGGKRFLVDPLLADEGAYAPFPKCARSHLRWPLVKLPLAIDKLLDVDAILVTHTHADHWDEAATKQVPKDKLIFVQNESDEEILRSQGFTHLRILGHDFEGIKMTKTNCQHGTKMAFADAEKAHFLGTASGIIFQHPNEKTVYLVGDTIWTQEVAENLVKYKPDVVIVNAGNAHVIPEGSIIMGKEDITRVHLVLSKSNIFASHLDAVHHCLDSRATIREYVSAMDLSEIVAIPEDGETVEY